MTRVQLDRQAAEALLARFDEFYDSVVEEVLLDRLAGRSAERRASVVLQARALDGDWARVTFSVNAVQGFCFVESPTESNLVLSLGLGIHLDDDGIFLDLAPATERPWEREDLKHSHQWVTGKAASVEVRGFE